MIAPSCKEFCGEEERRHAIMRPCCCVTIVNLVWAAANRSFAWWGGFWFFHLVLPEWTRWLCPLAVWIKRLSDRYRSRWVCVCRLSRLGKQREGEAICFGLKGFEAIKSRTTNGSYNCKPKGGRGRRKDVVQFHRRYASQMSFFMSRLLFKTAFL